MSLCTTACMQGSRCLQNKTLSAALWLFLPAPSPSSPLPRSAPWHAPCAGGPAECQPGGGPPRVSAPEQSHQHTQINITVVSRRPLSTRSQHSHFRATMTETACKEDRQTVLHFACTLQGTIGASRGPRAGTALADVGDLACAFIGKAGKACHTR